MRILYGVQTTGRGHIMRAREMVKNLKAKGHTIHILFSGRQPDMAGRMQEFQPFSAFQGLTFVTERGKLKILKTAMQLNFVRFYQDIRHFDASEFDLVITDYEPISARIARRHNIPSIGIGHQYAFMHRVPLSGDTFITRLVMRRFAPVDYPVGLHWHHFQQPICPPIITDAMPEDVMPDAKRILVYMPFESLQDTIDALQPLSGYDFYLYSAEVAQASDDKTMHLRPLSREHFLRDLGKSVGLISNAGFSSMSEALHLGKRLLVKPLSGQLEQESNAAALRKLQLGMTMATLNTEAIRAWLDAEDHIAPQNYPDVVNHLCQWVNDGTWSSYKTMAQNSWN
ncbi:MAG: hypothetical protein GF313_14985 [Caldithrix sp.]|nr:hypothetical protein [Caldithrix sp.]